MVPPDRVRAAYITARDALLAERTPEGFWVGELSSSALATAVAVVALHLVDSVRHRTLIAGGLRWLIGTQNADGGWGDTTKSFSNISTSMLCRAAFAVTGGEKEYPAAVARLEAYLTETCGRTPEERAEAIRRRYGKDRTFSVPILMTCALAGLVPWREVPRLPFELACLPQSLYRFAGFPVVSYALPALIAIGQCVHHFRGSWSPVRRLARGKSLRVLRHIQPSSGGYLEATPLTAFVVMSLASVYGANGGRKPAVEAVLVDGTKFLVESARPDGSWPIDTNLSVWVTTLSVNALAAADDLGVIDRKDELLRWLLDQQTTQRHPYTGAAAGGWGWSHCPGSVPDCDDTPGAMLAVGILQMLLDGRVAQIQYCSLPWPKCGVDWILALQNRDGGFPTFCRGWGQLPFDRSGADLTAHALRVVGLGCRWGNASKPYGAKATTRALGFLAHAQHSDGSWLPLWFGNQHAPDDINPVYGTARVLAAYRDLGLTENPHCRDGVDYLLSAQSPDGGWGGAAGCPPSVEETALAVEVLLDLAPADPRVRRGVKWLVGAVESGRFREPAPIGFYFAKLWYFEKLYPLIFTVAALGRAARII